MLTSQPTKHTCTPTALPTSPQLSVSLFSLPPSSQPTAKDFMVINPIPVFIPLPFISSPTYQPTFPENLGGELIIIIDNTITTTTTYTNSPPMKMSKSKMMSKKTRSIPGPRPIKINPYATKSPTEVTSAKFSIRSRSATHST